MLLIEENLLMSKDWIAANRRILIGRRKMSKVERSWIIPSADVKIGNDAPFTGVKVTFRRAGNDMDMNLFKVAANGAQTEATLMLKIDDTFGIHEDGDLSKITIKGVANTSMKIIVKHEIMTSDRLATIVGEVKHYHNTVLDYTRIRENVSDNAENICAIAGHLQGLNSKFANAPSPLPDHKLAELVRDTRRVLHNLKDAPNAAIEAVPQCRTRSTAVGRSLTSSFAADIDMTAASTSRKKRPTQSEPTEVEISKKKK